MAAKAGELPTGTVTFMFTDIEGSTRLLHELGLSRATESMEKAIAYAMEAPGGAENGATGC